MLKNTFIHVPGIGLISEQKIWSSGIYSWDDLLTGGLPFFSQRKRDLLKQCLEESNEQLSTFNPNFFGERLPPNHHWRIFPEFRELTAYLDIETTGLNFPIHQITTIAVYDGCSIFTYVQGQNLDQFKDDIQKYKVLVTYNGKCFDVPFIQNQFGIRLSQVHIDLRYLLRSVGYMGGLKGCEKKADIERGDLEGVEGYHAVLFWEDYQKDKNEKALETLLAYNVQDVINLETLITLSYNLRLKETPFHEGHQLSLSSPCPSNPFRADLETIERTKERIVPFRMWY